MLNVMKRLFSSRKWLAATAAFVVATGVLFAIFEVLSAPVWLVQMQGVATYVKLVGSNGCLPGSQTLTVGCSTR